MQRMPTLDPHAIGIKRTAAANARQIARECASTEECMRLLDLATELAVQAEVPAAPDVADDRTGNPVPSRPPAAALGAQLGVHLAAGSTARAVVPAAAMASLSMISAGWWANVAAKARRRR
jgi:hypothetical protein